MTSVNATLSSVTQWIKAFSEFGLALILSFVVIDILFPGTTGVVNNIGIIVSQFSKEGLSGLIALLLFLILFKRTDS